MPAPQRIAPYAVALTAEVVGSAGDDDELASGRFVLLHDPSAPEPWDGVWRAVTFARAELEPELASDPMLGAVGWSWLIDALDTHRLGYAAEAGTVTRVVSESFAGLADRPRERRDGGPRLVDPARPRDDRRRTCVAWSDLLCTIAGLPPLPEGVIALPGPAALTFARAPGRLTA